MSWRWRSISSKRQGCLKVGIANTVEIAKEMKKTAGAEKWM
jgi:hypothetical protein